MNIKFYVDTRKFVESLRYTFKVFHGNNYNRPEYRKLLHSYKDLYGASCKSTGNIKINLPLIYKDRKYNLIHSIYSTIMHECLHSAIRNEVEDDITQHCIIYDIENALFPGTVCKKTIDWYFIKDW